MNKLGPLIGAIDQGTSSTRFLVFAAETGEFVTYHQLEIKKVYPFEGWVEQDPMEIYNTVVECMEVVYQKLNELNIDARNIRCTGLTNQRESTIVWDKFTGVPLYNCIVWLDNRTLDLVDQTLDDIPGRDRNYLKNKTGLPISSYFSALKLKWLINNVPEVKEAIEENRLLFGTVDSWLLWKLTGQHLTDVTNASRTLLMDLESLSWDPYLCDFFKIPMDILPKILPSSAYFAKINKGSFENLPITGVIGDQSAALIGQKCFSIGQAKVTLGTGCFLIQNIGPGPLHGALKDISKDAKNNLVTTVAYQFGSNPPVYALEGSVAIAGAALTWLRDNLELISNYAEVEEIAAQDDTTGELYFVPAFQGLYAPYWDPHAAAIMIGLTQFTRRSHLIRATLDGVAYQCNDIISMMRNDGTGIKVDGGMSSNPLVCQILADISGCVVMRPKMMEATALGAAMVAGYHTGLWDIQSSRDTLESDQNGNTNTMNGHIDFSKKIVGEITRRFSVPVFEITKTKISSKKFDTFRPNIDEDMRCARITKWKDAVHRSQKWFKIERHEQKRIEYSRLASLPLPLFVLLSFGLHLFSLKCVSC